MAEQKKKEPKIRQYYKPDEKEAASIEHVYNRFYRMKDNPKRIEAEKEWDKGEQAWDQCNKEEEGMEEWQADYYVPLTTATVEQILSEMIDQSPRPIILPLSAEDKPRATVMRHVFDFTWETADGDEELENVLKDCLIYGNGFAQEYYWKDRRLIRSLVGMKKGEKAKRLPEYKETEVFEYDDCYMESVSPYELYFDEVARTINRGPYKARDAVRRYIMKIDDFRTFFSGDVWDPFNNVRFVRPGGDTNWYSYYKPPEDINKGDEVEVLWYWSRSPNDSLRIVANDVLIKDGPNPYKHKQIPFAMTYDVKRPHKFYHKGEPKLLESIQKEINTLRRMITDRNHLDIDKMWLVGRNEMTNEEDSLTRPHGIVRVDDPSNYKPIEYGDIPASVSLTIGEIQKDATRVTGVNDRFSVGQTPITATDAAIKKEQMMQSIKAKLRRLEKGFLVDVGRMRCSNIIQFYSQPKLEKILGEAGTDEFEKQKAEAQRQGYLQEIEGSYYRKEYRNIRIKGKELTPNVRGEIVEQPHQGYSFFDLKPEYFVPVSRGGFQIRFEAGSTMPVSKSLMVKQTQDAVTQLMPLATAGIGYDPIKLGDELLKSLDKDPEDFHIESAEKDNQKAREEILINLASQENEEVTRGAPIPPLGTPYATAAHTRIHLAYMRSPKGKALDDAKFKLLTKHTMGEISAQTMRGDVASLTGQEPPNANNANGATQPSAGSSPPYNMDMKAANPNMIQGGGDADMNAQQGGLMSRVFGLLKRKR
jgi:hypothetical protein